jgi:hypothetical protein
MFHSQLEDSVMAHSGFIFFIRLSSRVNRQPWQQISWSVVLQCTGSAGWRTTCRPQ